MVGCIGFHLGRGRGTGNKHSRAVAVLLPDRETVHGDVWGRIISVALAIGHLGNLNAFCRLPPRHANFSRPKSGARIHSRVQRHRAADLVFAERPAIRISDILNAPFVSFLSSFSRAAKNAYRRVVCCNDGTADLFALLVWFRAHFPNRCRDTQIWLARAIVQELVAGILAGCRFMSAISWSDRQSV